MSTLELVKLRSRYPNTGRMTLRHPVLRLDTPLDPTYDPTTFDALVREVLSDSTTPQVAESDSDGETTARKGGQAR